MRFQDTVNITCIFVDKNLKEFIDEINVILEAVNKYIVKKFHVDTDHFLSRTRKSMSKYK